MQQLGIAQEFHSKNIKLLLEAVTKQFLWHSGYLFYQNNLELIVYMSKVLRKPMVLINKEPHWALQNWNDIMASMRCGTYLDREVHTAGDLSDGVQQGIGSYPQTMRNKGNVSNRAPKRSTKTTFAIEFVTEQGSLS